MPKSVKRSMFRPHERVQLDTGDIGMTRQEFADECDVNALMARYEKTGIWPMPLREVEPRYFDASEVPNFHEAMEFMIAAETAFMSLPAVVRKEFDNDPEKFVEFGSKPENIGRMREWGLAPPEAAPEPPMRVEVVNPPSSSPAKPESATQ